MLLTAGQINLFYRKKSWSMSSLSQEVKPSILTPMVKPYNNFGALFSIKGIGCCRLRFVWFTTMCDLMHQHKHGENLNAWTGIFFDILLSVLPCLHKWLTCLQNWRICWVKNNYLMMKSWNKQWKLGWKCSRQKNTTWE